MPIMEESQHTQPVSLPQDVPAFLNGLMQRIEAKYILSTYGHRHDLSQNEAGQYVSQTNCYGFVKEILQRIHPLAYLEIEAGMKAMAPSVPLSYDGVPCPFHYAQCFIKQSLSHWYVLSSLSELKAGDLLVYFPEGYQLSPTPTNMNIRTGTHLMFVEEVDELCDDFQEIKIVDCTRQPHSKLYDSRYKGPHSEGGIGRACLFIKTKPSSTSKVTLRWHPKGRHHKKLLYAARLVFN